MSTTIEVRDRVTCPTLAQVTAYLVANNWTVTDEVVPHGRLWVRSANRCGVMALPDAAKDDWFWRVSKMISYIAAVEARSERAIALDMLATPTLSSADTAPRSNAVGSGEGGKRCAVPGIYFGVWPRSEEGHHEHTPSGWRARCVTPWSESTANLDGPVSALLAGVPVNSPGYLTATRDAPQHQWRTWHRSGVVQVGALVASGDWTLLAAWDRTGDRRSGSFSAFVLNGTLPTSEAIVAARSEFPIIWARIDRATMEGA